MTKEITPIEYAKLWGKSKQYVHRLLANSEYDKLPQVIKVTKYSRFYTLTVSKEFAGK